MSLPPGSLLWPSAWRGAPSLGPHNTLGSSWLVTPLRQGSLVDLKGPLWGCPDTIRSGQEALKPCTGLCEDVASKSCSSLETLMFVCLF